MHCANCDKTNGEFLKTAYGDYLCGDCWDEYICTETGMLEYFIGLCNEDYYASEFDADFICDVVKSYKINYDKLDFTPQQRFELEEKARELGLL